MARGFEPIAVVGQGCVLPGALTPAALWALVCEGRSAVAPAGPDAWRISPGADRAQLAREIASATGGYVTGFDAVRDDQGFAIDASLLQGLDPVFLWTLHAAREALRSAGLSPLTPRPRAALVLGNLSYPTPGLVTYALEQWARDPSGGAMADPRNRFMSGLPAHVAAQAVGFGGRSFALDAACASSLYAIKLACQQLQDGEADLALAGGVNHADDLFLHGGFTALHALSPSGQSRPFHRDADGLVPAQGAALLLLERLDDAVAHGRTILGVIRGIGLSNDGRSRGLTVPDSAGQVRALRAAYEESGLSPRDISVVECHATGTVVGDAAEVRTLRAVFDHAQGLPVGSLKSNLGHLITASGAAAVIKMIAALRERVLPPSLTVDAPIDELGDGRFRLLRSVELWEAPADGAPRRTAISNFGFGGNNAHLILEEWAGPSRRASTTRTGGYDVTTAAANIRVAVVAQSVHVRNERAVIDNATFAATVLGGRPAASDARGAGGGAETVELDVAGLRFPPNDLKAALAQQTLLLSMAQHMAPLLHTLPADRTSVLVGMQCDAEIARHAIRWRAPGPWIEALPASLAGNALSAATVLGSMPNVVANRLSHQFDFRGPSFAVSSEELSGIAALHLGARALREGEIDAAVIAAVDLGREPVSTAAVARMLGEERDAPADAAVLLVLKREADALRDGNSVLALLEASDSPSAAVTLEFRLTSDDPGLTPLLGHAHAAAGLLHVAAAVAACREHAVPSPLGPMPWIPRGGARLARVEVEALGGQRGQVHLRAPDKASGRLLTSRPRLGLFAADTVAGVLSQMRRAQQAARPPAADAPLPAEPGAVRVAVVAENDDQYQARLQRAMTLLEQPGGAATPGAVDDGIHVGLGTPAGELAFIYTGAAGAYPNMGRDLALAFPDLVDRLAARAGTVHDIGRIVYPTDPARTATPFDKLLAASYLSQLHTEFTRRLLGLVPTATIGYCSGETNALFALDAWNDLDAFCEDVARSRVYDHWLSGDFACLRAAWDLEPEAAVDWATWRLRAPVAEIRAALAGETRAHLAIINTPSDVVVAGDPEACARVASRFGRRAARIAGYDFVMHCPEARPFEARWHALHTRPTADVPGVRFYTHATRSSYRATMQAAADALTGQAMNLVDFPTLVEQAYADGVRVFVEHGPHAGCTKWITDILGDRPHVAVALDRYGHSSLQVAFEAAAALFAAGVPVQPDALLALADDAPQEWTGPVNAEASPARIRSLPLSLPMHPAAVPPMPVMPAPVVDVLPAPPRRAMQAERGTSKRAEAAVAVLGAAARTVPLAPAAGATAGGPATTRSPAPHHERLPEPAVVEPGGVAHAASRIPAAAATARGLAAMQSLAAHHEQLSALHQAFLRQQFAAQAQFRDLMLAPILAPRQPLQVVATDCPMAGPTVAEREPLAPVPSAAPNRGAAPVPVQAQFTHAMLAPIPAPRQPPVTAIDDPMAVPPVAGREPLAPMPTTAPSRGATPGRQPTGPRFDRAALEVHAGGVISSIFGSLFAQQDGYARQVRMPEPPLLLADRVLGIEGEAGSMGSGTIWTETDVQDGAFYLHEGRMPAGILVESGQADLMLISWLGADFHNKGERVYRLLGCELISHGPLPRIGDTLHYEIVIDGHAEQHGVRLFFFHYDCWVNGELRMSVRNGQAGFFTDGELARSAGVLWSAEAATPKAGARQDAAVVCTTHRALTADMITALCEGRLVDCYGPGFEPADAHTRTPTIASGRMRLLDAVTDFDPSGGPWARGYLRATLALTPDRWFFDGHFKNDPCMPGTLMLEGGLQAMQIYMTGLGFTLDRDGWRFEPVPGENYALRCRGQATPASHEVVYEIFVEEVVGGDTPTLYADILGSVDGQKAFHCRRMGLRLVPAWPLDRGRTAVAIIDDPRPVAVVDGFRFDHASLLACAWGVPSSAFGPAYARFDGTRRLARLPGPPYHFMSRVAEVSGAAGGLQVGSRAEIDYDVLPDAWYFAQNNATAMPFPVLLETALQPCGWLAVYAGGALQSERDLCFRNLDGVGTQHCEVGPHIGTLRVSTTLTSVSSADAILIMGFDVVVRAGDRTVYTLKTVFGFFPAESMTNQAGLPMSNEHQAQLAEPSEVRVELGELPPRYFAGTLRLPTGRLAMIDRVTGLWTSGPRAGKAGLGRLRAEKDVAAHQWFFKAHFFQDPVQPGSLGIEALLQAFEVLAIECGAGRGIAAPRFETQAAGVAMTWKYRGQVVPRNRVVVADVEIMAIHDEPEGRLVVALGSLWVDGKRIYEATGLAVRIVPGTTR